MTIILLKVVDVIKETVEAVTICFRQPGLKKIKYYPGQYISLIFRINGRRYIRPYSFSSSPEINEYLEITVKRVLKGIVSNHINDNVKIGDMVEVMLPVMGDFIFDENRFPASKQIVLWGVGSGITPLISIAKYILGKKTGNKVILVYGNRHHESVIFSKKIHELSNSHKDDFIIWHFFTQLKVTEEQRYLVQGRISPLKVLKVLAQTDPLIENTIHYICGPVGLKESVKKALFEYGVRDNIYSEDFELIKDPREFTEISTENVIISLSGVDNNVEVTKGKSILESGLDAGLELPYSCQTGNCNVCKGKLISGKLKMIGLPVRPEKLLEDEYLLCCSYPLTNNVSIAVV